MQYPQKPKEGGTGVTEVCETSRGYLDSNLGPLEGRAASAEPSPSPSVHFLTENPVHEFPIQESKRQFQIHIALLVRKEGKGIKLEVLLKFS